MNKNNKNFKYVCDANLGMFQAPNNVAPDFYHKIAVSRERGGTKGAIRFYNNVITGNYWDIVEFFIDHCTQYHQPTKYWDDVTGDRIKADWEAFKKMDINDTQQAYELADKFELMLAQYQEFGIFYKTLWNKKDNN